MEGEETSADDFGQFETPSLWTPPDPESWFCQHYTAQQQPQAQPNIRDESVDATPIGSYSKQAQERQRAGWPSSDLGLLRS